MSVKGDASLNESLGDLSDFAKEKNGITGKTDQCRFNVIVYSEGIIRVTTAKEDRFDDFSYAVVVKPQELDYTCRDAGEEIVIATRKTILTITKRPVRFRFQDAGGVVLNEDDPAFGVSLIGDELTAYKKLQDKERFIGMGEKTGPLNRRGEAYLHWNTDYAEYPVNGDPLYCTFPFYIGLHHDRAYGIFLDSPAMSRFNFGASTDRFSSFSVEAGPLDYYFIHEEKVAGILEDYTWLTGRMPMPPLWSLGFQQCRWSYFPDKQAVNVANTFREKNIPADVIYLDIDYMDAYKIFTWHPERFSRPETMIDQLTKMGFKVVVIIDPGVKEEKGYRVYDTGKENDVFVKFPDGTDYRAKVWPGWCNFPDFTNPAAREWWGDLHREFVGLGIEGYWNDMNEFSTVGQSLPHLIQFNGDGRKSSLRRIKNVYGGLMARATYEGVKKHLKNKRPFVLTRSAYAGTQRYAAVWTGDNSATNEHMLLGVRMVNSLGLTGMAFTGSDIGGFAKESDQNLYARWIALGAFTPFCRVHAADKTRPSEPWGFGYMTEDIAANYIKFRYQALPYLYSAFYETAQTGMPVARTLAIDYSHEDWVYDKKYQNQFLFGPFFLVAPVESCKSLTKVFLPEGGWYNLHTDEKYEGGKAEVVDCPVSRFPVFVKQGAIIPMQSVRNHTEEATDGVLRIHVYYGAGETAFTYYEDDGKTFDHLSGVYCLREIKVNGQARSIRLSPKIGTYTSVFDRIRWIFHGFPKEVSAIQVNNRKIKLQKERFSYFNFEYEDHIFDVEEEAEERNFLFDVLVADMANSDEAININWQ